MKNKYEFFSVAMAFFFALIIFSLNMLIIITLTYIDKDDDIESFDDRELENESILLEAYDYVAINLTSSHRWSEPGLIWKWEVEPASERIVFEIQKEDQLLLVIDSSNSNEEIPLSTGDVYHCTWKNTNNRSVNLTINTFSFSISMSGKLFFISFNVIAVLLIITTFIFAYRNRKDIDKSVALMPNIIPLFTLFLQLIDFGFGVVLFLITFIISFYIFDINKISLDDKYGKIIMAAYVIIMVLMIGGSLILFIHDSPSYFSYSYSSMEYADQIFVNEEYFEYYTERPLDYSGVSLFLSFVMLSFLLTRLLIRELLPYLFEYEREEHRTVCV
ncbi:MAG: hypothetical protein JXA22_07135 [Candidatus Thermoplasmatota archaeon]|nr:hypothetical protein [Candidatus Thermoplasmatota archaeon]